MSYVYFIKPVGCDGPVKIGRSRDPEARRQSLQISSPLDLELMAQIKGDETLERRFHALFHAEHLRNEWFVCSREMRMVIEEIVARTFNPASLPAPIYLPRRVGQPKALARVVTAEEIAAAQTPAGGWTRAQLAEWGVPWPPPKGWRQSITRKAAA